ncbi:MAG: eCIS core domain-containing protein, partial [Flavisolibacter sp.]
MTRIASQKAENKSQSIVGSLFRKNEDSSVNKNIVPSKLENTPAFNFGNINFHNSDDNSWIQPKLEINQPGDRYEQEADAMADKVMRMSDKDVAQNSYNTSGTTIQRKCAECEKEDEEKKVQRKESNNSSQSFAPPIVHKVLNSSAGKPMDINTRSFMESRFGYDFSHVRIHDNDKAAESANSINALAYTSGNNIVFNNGAYLPNMDSGKRLLAHELTHVMQQQSKSGNQIKLQCKSPNDKRRQERPSAISRISKLLSTSFWSFDFAVTDDEAREVLTILEGLEPVELMETIMKMRLSGAWKTLHQEVPDSDSGRLTEIEIKTDPNVGYIMFGDELKLKGWLPDEHKFQEFNVSVSINGIYLPILAPPIQVISLLPQDAVDTIAKSLENAKVCPWSALILSVVSRGIKYGHQSGPVRGEIPFNAKSIVPSPLSLSKQTNKKRDQFWAFYKSLSMRDEKDIIAGQFYIAQLDKSLINFKTPEELWTWALEESNKKTAPKREFLSWQATFKRNWEENIKKNPEEASYYHELYLKYTEWIVTHTEDDYRKYNAEAIAKQTIDYVFGKKWKQKELELRKQILEKQQKSSLDSPEFKENLDKVITIIELKILRTAPPQTAEDTTRGVGYLIEPSDTERTVRRIIADKMLHDYLDLTAKESKVDPELFVNHWLVSHPKEFETLMLVRAYPSVEKYDVPIEIPAYETVIEVGIGFIPIVGEIVGAYEVIAGEDLFGRKLSPQERAILGILILLPAAAKLFKVGKGAITASRL